MKVKGSLIVLDPTDLSLYRQKQLKHSLKYLCSTEKKKVLQEVMHGKHPFKMPSCNHARFDIKHPSFLTGSLLMSNLMRHVLRVISECVRMIFADCDMFLFTNLILI